MPLIEPGKKAPPFTLPDSEGRKHALKDFVGRPVVVYFYPKDDTPGCTREACDFRDLQPRFKHSKAVVFGVSPDSEASHARFAAKFSLDFTLLSDPKDDRGTPKTCDKYGVWQEKKNYGKTYMGIVRTTYLIGPNGKVVRRWDKVKVDGHAEEVLAAVDGLT